MSVDQDMRGAATVGQLHAIAPWEAFLVCHLRLWCDGVEGRDEVRHAWGFTKTDNRGEVILDVFDDLIQTLLMFARRPLIRHSRDCECLGADEGVFIQIVSAASEGQLDDAALMASLIAFPTHAERIAILAGQVGTGFRAKGSVDRGCVKTSSTQQFLH
jgi:hypothetical protein